MHTMMRRISAGNGENLSSTSLVLNNNDLLIKILLCLHVKYLLVLKPVSKHWYSTITGSYFMEKHCILHRNKLSLSGLYILCDRPNEQHIPNYDMLLLNKAAKISTNVVRFLVKENEQPPIGGGLKIQQSCNGLFLCKLPSSGHLGTRYIYNPSTRRYRTIPPPPPFNNENMNYWQTSWQFYLAFDPQKSLYYEIVFLWRFVINRFTRHDIGHYDYQMAVYSSKTGSWRLCGCVKLDSKLLLSRHCVSWNGCLNWIDGFTLYYLNIAQQVLKTSQCSDELMQKYFHGPVYFEECVGHMYLILHDSQLRYYIDFFEMEIDYSGWKPICRADLSGLANRYGNSYSMLKVAHMQGDGDEDELKALMLLPGNKIVSYDLKIKSFEEIGDYKTSKFDIYTIPAAYIGSLANV